MSHVHLQFCLHKHSVDMNINVVAFPLSLVIGFLLPPASRAVRDRV